ncbi:MAG: 4-hydroxy-tetrahydrodipicolinate synthase [Planctomycetes bacterium]|nr:4-hydroxy-tetrahydrodipicolinate synthase [Planctomycetota bacterium]
MFKGSITALVTPMDANGKLDLKSLDKLVEWQIEQGIQGLVPCGSTGESINLTDEERGAVIERVVKVARKRVPVIAGTGTSSTDTTVAYSKAAEKLGVDGLLVVTPAYNKPQQEGLYRHFGAVAKATKLPVILYNVPGRAAVNLLPETCARLDTDFKNIVALKDAAANLEQTTQVLIKTGLDVLSGDDGLTLPMMALGAKGIISVVSNVAPKAIRELSDACAAMKIVEAREMHRRLTPLVSAMFIETNPVPAKAALAMMGKIPNEFPRLPLAPLSDKSRDVVKKALKDFGLT